MDAPAEFRRKNQMQMLRAKAALQEAGRRFIYFAAEKLEELTPGFGNQYEGAPGKQARYIPTGRLRGGLNYTRAPIRETSKGYAVGRTEDGPFSAFGQETLARIWSQLQADTMGGVSYLENDVAYGDDIVRGANNHAHIGKRDFPLQTQVLQHDFARKALTTLGGAL